MRSDNRANLEEECSAVCSNEDTQQDEVFMLMKMATVQDHTLIQVVCVHVGF